ncbi:MAG: asparaginase [Bacillota bacterium]|uniref:Asparaginase n=1 Tax=Virgibacillus salarius TaxID=447199 RepID=A0A941DR16_9BACI|nr:asparaginase [Virgibacillus salarius]MBR7795050.1 asparaginase [Virgibacillus salarius]NAZ07768.1 asparaginase [Agaribacter marinus]
MISTPIIAEEYRGGTLENVYQGLICVLNEKKEILYEYGDVKQSVFYRSAMKPLQAIPLFTTDIMEKYDLTTEEAALFTASQRGESYHQEALERLMNKLQLSEDMLVCQQSYPLNEQPKISYIREHLPKRKLLHNCSGKHLGFLAYSREKNYDLSNYEWLGHPLQQEVLNYVADLSETPKKEIKTAIDGCGVPVHSVPLKNMAISFLKFIQPSMIHDSRVATAVKRIGEVMNKHPRIVASHNFICTALLEDENIIAKGGAQGVYCLALKREKISISLKVLTGSELIWPLLVAKLLQKLNYHNKETIDRLLNIRSNEIFNDNGKVVGETKIRL